ncbi:CRP-like cAMP-binding protein [Kushneria sinocarnis]|uniref:CRP-like cAMP-binding protein n=1 Tax=Kushneria sinocarnis TaxID=595502 RepID=A0A420WU52_9GAMM|nr:Crp/Fnr family transcriptional regulator [Kushneria sinocarnis]RKQ96976.1 CRP-like cAMP-binding protein [Kushneria sinocarnis]
MTGSCIVRHFNHFFPLDDGDEALLEEFERHPEPMRRHQHLWRINETACMLYTLKSGWAYAYRTSPRGEMKVLEVFLPGDIIGLHDFTFGHHLTGVRMLTDGFACAFPYQDILAACEQSRTLTAAFFADSARERAVMNERLTTLMHCSARMKLAHFIIEIRLRLAGVTPDLEQRFEFPFNQKILASLLGLTNVHVSRVLSELERDGLLSKQRRTLEIHDYDRLHEEAQFNDACLHPDMHRLCQ